MLCHTLPFLSKSLSAWPPETADGLEGMDHPPHCSHRAAGTSFEGQPQGWAARCSGFALPACTCGGGQVWASTSFWPRLGRAAVGGMESNCSAQRVGPPDPQISPGADLSTSAYEREERRPGIDQARLSLRLRPHGLHACRVPGSHSVGKTEGQDAHSPSCAF